MVHKIELKTRSRTELINITADVEKAIKTGGIESGTCIVYVPHTTAAVTINENADPSVAADITGALGRLVPAAGGYRHAEGNSDAHIKAAIVGSSRTVFFENSRIMFGAWQGIFFCEFDGPRTRTVFIKIIGEPKR